MVDVLFREITDGAKIVFIQNKRGEEPRLVYGVVTKANPASMYVLDESGTVYRVQRSQRSCTDGRMLRAVVIKPRSDIDGSTFDFVGNPISVGCTVAFMEYPSQGFSGALIVGKVCRIGEDGLTIQVESSVMRKYSRKPGEVAVVD